MRPAPHPVQPGQRSVWDFPRPPIVETEPRHLEIVHRGVVVAATGAAYRTLETSHPPTYYFPRDGIALGVLVPAPGTSFCEWKGQAAYFDVHVGGDILAGVAWTYPAPIAAFEALRDHVAFYAAPFDACYVGGERVTPQPGGFYGGWITPDLAGPFKGGPGSRFW